jgi:predicted nucleic acid-binding protein
MNGKVVFDSNPVIDLFKGKVDLEQLRYETTGKEQCVSVITRMELLAFPEITPDEEDRINLFLDKREVIPINDEIEKLAIIFRRRTRNKLPDSLIAATAIVLGATLITRDDRLLKTKFSGLNMVSVSIE